MITQLSYNLKLFFICFYLDYSHINFTVSSAIDISYEIIEVFAVTSRNKQTLVYTSKSDVPSSVRTIEARICLVVKKVSKYSNQFSLQ
jgi:hypothetical protein